MRSFQTHRGTWVHRHHHHHGLRRQNALRSRPFHPAVFVPQQLAARHLPFDFSQLRMADGGGVAPSSLQNLSNFSEEQGLIRALDVSWRCRQQILKRAKPRRLAGTKRWRVLAANGRIVRAVFPRPSHRHNASPKRARRSIHKHDYCRPSDESVRAKGEFH